MNVYEEMEVLTTKEQMELTVAILIHLSAKNLAEVLQSVAGELSEQAYEIEYEQGDKKGGKLWREAARSVRQAAINIKAEKSG